MRHRNSRSDGSLYGWFNPGYRAAATCSSTTVGHQPQYVLAHYVLLHELGYNVVVYDYGGFGESSDTASLTTLIPTRMRSWPTPGPPTELQPAGSSSSVSLGTCPLWRKPHARLLESLVILEGSFELDFLPLWSYAPIAWFRPRSRQKPLRGVPSLDATQYVGRITLPSCSFIHQRTRLRRSSALSAVPSSPSSPNSVPGRCGHGLSSFDQPTLSVWRHLSIPWCEAATLESRSNKSGRLSDSALVDARARRSYTSAKAAWSR